MSHGGDDGGIPEEHEEHVNHEAWVIPYADLLTLLMAMFIALFAISSVDTNKFQALARGFSTALGGGHLDSGIGGAARSQIPVVGSGNGGNNGILDGDTLSPNDNSMNNTALAQILAAAIANQQGKAQQQQKLADIAQKIEDAAKAGGFSDKLKLQQEGKGLVVTLVTDQVLFDSGHADLRPEGEDLLRLVAAALAGIDNPIFITGYTDNAPIHTPEFPDNRHLSVYRALSVEDFFVSLGLNPEQMTAQGRGELDPIAPNDAAHRGQNRRVEIVIQNKAVKQVQDQNGLNDKPVTPTTNPAAPNAQPTIIGARPNLSPLAQ